jgi:hypothetical protein
MSKEDLIPAKKGEIRNPKGKPKGTKNFKTLYKKYLALTMKPEESGFDIPFVDKDIKLSLKDMMILRHIKKAIGKADYKDIEMIINRVDGLLKQNIDTNIKTDKTILETIAKQLSKNNEVQGNDSETGDGS